LSCEEFISWSRCDRGSEQAQQGATDKAKRQDQQSNTTTVITLFHRAAVVTGHGGMQIE
jgi:hypothetical protein